MCTFREYVERYSAPITANSHDFRPLGLGYANMGSLIMVKGLPYQEAAVMLGVSRNTVASHVKNIYSKLEVGSRGEAVFEALSRGIVKIDSSD